MCDLSTALPRVYSDAIAVTANPDRYAHRPTLLHLARLVLANGHVTGNAPQPAPALRLIQGGAA